VVDLGRIEGEEMHDLVKREVLENGARDRRAVLGSLEPELIAHRRAVFDGDRDLHDGGHVVESDLYLKALRDPKLIGEILEVVTPRRADLDQVGWVPRIEVTKVELGSAAA
jgi:hypothetical protein